MRLRLLSCLFLLPLLGCPLTGPEEEGKVITASFSTQFTEVATHQGGVTLNCNDLYTLSGTITFVVREATGGTLDGVGRINAAQKHVSTSGSAGCMATPDRDTAGDWTADLSGTPDQASLILERTGTGTFPYTTKFAFSGTVSAEAASGTLAFTQTAQGITGTNTQSSSSAQATISVTLR